MKECAGEFPPEARPPGSKFFLTLPPPDFGYKPSRKLQRTAGSCICFCFFAFVLTFRFRLPVV